MRTWQRTLLTLGLGGLLAGTTALVPADARQLPGTDARSGAVTTLPDPLQLGPHSVTVRNYQNPAGVTLPDYGTVEFRGKVHYPTDLAGGPAPLVVLLHGHIANCPPAAPPGTECPSYLGFDYLGENLASWGYIVVSVSANVVDGSGGVRAELVQAHLDYWNTLATVGNPWFGTIFVGKVDLQNVGTMGHSAGGEGVVAQYLYNKTLGSPYGVHAVFGLAPRNTDRNIPTGVPFDALLPYCDGDQADLPGVHYYDDALYPSSVVDPTPKYLQLVMNANHNQFNTLWPSGGGAGGNPDCAHPMTRTQHQDVGEAYIAAFFRMHLGGESAFAPYFDGSTTIPGSISFATVHPSYHGPDGDRLDVNRYLTPASLTTNDLGGAVTHAGLSRFDLCGKSPSDLCGSPPGIEPHVRPLGRTLPQLTLGWGASIVTPSVTNVVPAAYDNVSGFDALTFRAARNMLYDTNPNGPDLKVGLVDVTGATAWQPVSSWSTALFVQPAPDGWFSPKLVLSTVRIPLSAFVGVDLTNVRKVVIASYQTNTGAVVMTDLDFVD